MNNIFRVRQLLIVVWVALFSLTAQADLLTITKEHYDQIDIGMTKAQVIKIMGGKPDKSIEVTMEYGGRDETWIYQGAGSKAALETKGFEVIFLGEKVNRKTSTQ